MKTCSSCFSVYEEELDVCPYCGYVEGLPAKELYHLYPGMIVANRYIIGKVQGFGGFGITYRAWDMKLGAIVAIKEYFPNGLVNRIPGQMEVILYSGQKLTEFKKGLDRFLEEARNMSNFNSQESIVNVFDFFEANSTAYIVMEFLDGVTLKEFLKSNNKFIGEDLILRIIINVLDGLSAIHKKGIVHRDISPDNIFICSNNKIKIIDFGAAQFSSEDEKTRAVILKPGYAPPEQYRTKSRQGSWTDIYAVGATMYYLVTGVVPEESTDRVVNDELVEPKDIRQDIPGYINNSIMKAMSINEELRFRTTEDFKKALLQEKEVRTIKEELRRRRARRIATIVIAFILICATTLSSLYYVKLRSTTLKDACISIWIPETENAQERLIVLQQISEEFRETYENIIFDLKIVPKKEYQTGLLDNEHSPLLFDSTEIELDERYHCVNLRTLYIDSSCIGASSYDSCFNKGLKLPLGFVASVEYIRTALAEDNSPTQINADTFEIFISSESAVWMSNTSYYFKVLSAIPGRYTVQMPDDGEACYFTEVWSVNQKSKAEIEAAKVWLTFLLTDSAQDVLHVQNRSGSLPVNCNVLDVFCRVYDELEFINETTMYKFK